MDLFPSDSVGIVKYEPLKALGRGSFGLVSLFRNKESKDLCVIKKIYAEDQTKQQLLNIRDEVRLLSALRHPNIVAYRETFIDQTDRNAICIVMDFCDGGDLDKRIRHAIELNYRFDENQIMSWITQLVMALEYLHKKNIIHRDLKSQNVFLMKNGMVKLGDFGVAKTISSTVLARTMVGTPYYLSPEVVKGDAYPETHSTKTPSFFPMKANASCVLMMKSISTKSAYSLGFPVLICMLKFLPILFSPANERRLLKMMNAFLELSFIAKV
eukprot:TRINITY_DN6527_c0_g1_i5.p1 TRINITY_DN6527_c0_g1~~TRINITY_DN6527_c0_g1_i5.p1  ORF type:complete len:270 (-),score=51.51 TRINITY_DN6527_c0_g1_i5:4-813(-)